MTNLMLGFKLRSLRQQFEPGYMKK
jgi:hypothetical protein